MLLWLYLCCCAGGRQAGSSVSLEFTPGRHGVSQATHPSCHSHHRHHHTASSKVRRQFMSPLPPPPFPPPGRSFPAPPGMTWPPFLAPGMPQQLPRPAVGWPLSWYIVSLPLLACLVYLTEIECCCKLCQNWSDQGQQSCKMFCARKWL